MKMNWQKARSVERSRACFEPMRTAELPSEELREFQRRPSGEKHEATMTIPKETQERRRQHRRSGPARGRNFKGAID
jgi:hypothetical protein